MICSTAITIVIPRKQSVIPICFCTQLGQFHVKSFQISGLETPLILKTRSSSLPMAMEQFSSSSSSSTSLILTSGASGRINALFSVRALKSFLRLINAVVLFLVLPFRGRRRTTMVPAADKLQPSNNKEFDDCGAQLRKMRVPATIVPWKSSATSGSGTVVDPEVAGRRALAIKRVVQDDDPNSIRQFSLFVTARGDTIFTQSWFPVSIKIRGLVVLMHGLNEHSGRYSDFAKQLNSHGFKVYGMDWIVIALARLESKPQKDDIFIENGLAMSIGHGGSDGLHSYVHSLDYAVSDLKSFLDKVLAENPGLPCFCFGHSTGAAIVLKAILDPKVQSRIAGLVLTSPAVGVQPSHPIFVVLAPIFSFLLPRFRLSAVYKKGMPVSRDPEALVAKYSDPLVYTGAIRVRTGYEILRITTYLQQNLNRLEAPFLVLHGTADTVTDPEASQKLYVEASSADKTIKLFEGFLHDLLFEPEREDIMNDIIEWLNCRVFI